MQKKCEIELLASRCNIYFNWSLPGVGFGQMDVRSENNQFYIANECMNREKVRQVLIGLANHIADNAILDDDPLNP